MAGTNASIKALRELLRNQAVPLTEMGRHFKEITGTNDRLIAVVCGSIVEAALKGLLERGMPNGPGKLFDVSQPLSTFSAKIGLAYSLGLITNDVRRNADYIREILEMYLRTGLLQPPLEQRK